jgi:hypothetical protein
MAVVIARWADGNVRKYGKRIDELNQRFPKVIPQEINKVGNKAKTQVVRSLTKQTGLPRKTIVKAVQVTMAGGPRYSYDMVTRGGNIRLKYLTPRETGAGVVARPFGKSTLYPGTFMKGGQFPGRKDVPKFGGHVFYRLNPSGTKITYARSGVFIPKEMTTGATRAAFERIAGPLLQQRMEAVLNKLVR